MATLSNGNLVRVSGTAPVSLVILGQTCYVPSPQTASNLFGSNWGSLVQTVSQGTFNSVPVGPAFTSGACLVQASGQSPQYLYTSGLKHWIVNENVLSEYNFNSGNLITGVNPQLIEAMPQGVDIAQ